MVSWELRMDTMNIWIVSSINPQGSGEWRVSYAFHQQDGFYVRMRANLQHWDMDGVLLPMEDYNQQRKSLS